MSPRALVLFRLAALALLAGGVWGIAYMLSEFVPHVGTGQIHAEAWAFAAITTAIVAGATGLTLTLLARCARAPEGRVLALMLAALAFIAGGSEASYLLRQRHDFPWLLDTGIDFLTPLSFMVAAAALLRFTVLFPRPLRAEEISGEAIFPRARAWLMEGRRVWLLGVGIALVGEAGLLAAMWWRSRVENPPVVWPLHKLLLVGILLFFLTVCVANLRTGYRNASEAGRRRIYWILEGLLAGTVVLLLASAVKLTEMMGAFEIGLRIWYPLTFLASVLVIIVFVGIAMLYEGALDPALAIRRTAKTGAVALVMVAVFAVTQQLVQELLMSSFGLGDRAGGTVTGVIVALSLDPVQRRVNRVVAAFFDRSGIAARPAVNPAPTPHPG
jgi:hypothetical protein